MSREGLYMRKAKEILRLRLGLGLSARDVARRDFAERREALRAVAGHYT